MKRGEIWWVNFDPAIGSEIKKTRPAIIISNDISNQYSTRVQVIPATSATQKLYPCEAFITIKGKKSKAMADQIMTVSKQRLYDKIGRVSNQDIEDIDYILSLQLGLS